MTTRQKFKRAVIEAIHGLPYEKAIEKEENIKEKLYQATFELGVDSNEDWRIDEMPDEYVNFPITIGRVMQAFLNKEIRGNINIDWIIIKENIQECTDDDQTDETIEKLLKLLEK